MGFEPVTSRVLPYPYKQNHETDDGTENAVKRYLQQIPLPKQMVKGRAESITEQPNNSGSKAHKSPYLWLQQPSQNLDDHGRRAFSELNKIYFQKPT